MNHGMPRSPSERFAPEKLRGSRFRDLRTQLLPKVSGRAPSRFSPHRTRAQDESRVPELVLVRYGRMLASPFTFYREAAAIMAADLASLPSSGLRTQLCGDAQLSNFGAFEAPDRRPVFDINDFDERLPGPFEWDVKRLAASFAIGRSGRGAPRRPPDR